MRGRVDVPAARHPRALSALTYLLDGDGGDENLKSYPLEDSDLTLSSILRNPLLYQEGWGVDAIKHSLAYSGGLSRGYVRTYAPAAAFGFDAFSPYTTRSVIDAARGDSVRAGARRRRVAAEHAQAGRRQRRRQGGAGHRHAGQREAAIPGRRHGDAARAGLEGVVPADVQRALAGSAEGGRRVDRDRETRLSARNARCKMQNAKRRVQRKLVGSVCILNFAF